MEPDFDDSSWPNAATWGRNDADDSHWGPFIPQPVGYPDTAGHVKPGIADDAEWIWCVCTISFLHHVATIIATTAVTVAVAATAVAAASDVTVAPLFR